MNMLRIAGNFSASGLPSFGTIAEELLARSELFDWYQADPEFGAHVTDGKVDTILGQKGAASLVQATADNRPAYAENALNGYPAAVFDGANDRLVCSVQRNFTLAHGLAVIARSGDTTYPDVILSANSSSLPEYISFAAGGLINFVQGNKALTLPAAASGDWNVIVTSANGAGTLRLWVNGRYIEATGGNNSTMTSAALIVGALNNAGSSIMTGSVTDVMQFDGDILAGAAPVLDLVRDVADFTYGLRF
ncbi:hypothetical protein [Sphingomonas sp. VDB2]|uniref:hypothetical protein n=1 Tax=Sphingomonas sp. VDB2 TaxID=3228751 RepID=UPI003A809A8B